MLLALLVEDQAVAKKFNTTLNVAMQPLSYSRSIYSPF